MPRSLPYSVLDVFAERPLEGNQLAVFHDATSLSTAEMQAIARETNLSETTFILPSDPATEARDGVRVRIFTTEEELPFAGHPTLGTATWLHDNHSLLRSADTITLRLDAGPIPIRFAHSDPGIPGIRATMQQNDPVFGIMHDIASVAAAIGLKPEDLSPHHLPQTVSTGMPFVIVLLRSMEAAQRLQIPQREANLWLHDNAAKFFYCIAPTATQSLPQGPHWHARMQFYNGEDPATGSAAGCCIAWLVRHGLAQPDHAVIIEQGLEMFRPSRITAQASLNGQNVHSVLISGRTIPVAEGRLFLP
jgi:trans-2,3-dihydro-3-hydroxyanthranilate isomerase